MTSKTFTQRACNTIYKNSVPRKNVDRLRLYLIPGKCQGKGKTGRKIMFLMFSCMRREQLKKQKIYI